MEPVVMRTDVPGFPVRRGKVRDVYDLGDRLVIVTTDRISAFDWVMERETSYRDDPVLARLARRAASFAQHVAGGHADAVSSVAGGLRGSQYAGPKNQGDSL